MLAFIKGRIRLVKDDFMVVETRGLGYKIYVPRPLIDECHKLSGRIALHIHQHQTDRSSDLYGFKTYADLEMFELLITINGIGPKAAATLLSTFSGEEIKNLIINQDDSTLATAKGIGVRAAYKICHELLDKVSEPDEYDGLASVKIAPSREALEALMELGYNQIEAQAALRMVPREITEPKEKVKEALKNLGR